MDGVDQTAELGVGSLTAVGLKVAGEPTPEVARLAHIDHLAEAVTENVNAGLGRDLPGMIFRNGHFATPSEKVFFSCKKNFRVSKKFSQSS